MADDRVMELEAPHGIMDGSVVAQIHRIGAGVVHDSMKGDTFVCVAHPEKWAGLTVRLSKLGFEPIESTIFPLVLRRSGEGPATKQIAGLLRNWPTTRP